MWFIDLSMNHMEIKGRGAQFNIQNRFEQVHINNDLSDRDEYFDIDDENKVQTVFFTDHSKSILSKNESPDLGMMYSINPYRGCEHGCIYCYARPTHEYLGFSSGLDFETKIMIKPDAPKLLEEAFLKKSWVPQTIVMSGNTDCYQPVEKKLKITRGCLEIFLKYQNPVTIISKNALVQRDIDILRELAKLNLARVVISITSLKNEVQRKMEPRTSIPLKRLQTVEMLARNGISVGVNVAPIVPGLTDEEMPTILKEATENGASFAGKVILRLPHAVKDLFVDWVKREFPDRANKIINRLKEMHGESLYNSEWRKRMSGEGKWAETLQQIFEANCRKLNLNKDNTPLSTHHFRRISNQTELF